MTRFPISAEKNGVRLQTVRTIFGLVTVKNNQKQGTDCVCAIFKIGLSKVRVALMLHVVVASPPTGVAPESQSAHGLKLRLYLRIKTSSDATWVCAVRHAL